MRRILAVLIGSFLYVNVVFASVVMDTANIKVAQEYGMMRYQENFFNFAKQWIVFEEKSKTVDEQGERLYVYTPFYLVALNARERLLSSQTINVSDGQVVLDAYRDSLPISVVFYVQDLSAIKENLNASLLQGDSIVPAFDFSVQNTVVVQTKVVREAVPTQAKAEVVQEKKDDSSKGDSQTKEENKQPAVETTFVEKTVPALYRVQIFFYFDIRQVDLNAPATLVVKPNGERERRFNFSFADMD